MNMLNSIILEGDITKAGEIVQFTDGQHQLEVTIAVKRQFSKRDGSLVDETSEFDVIAYGSIADFLAKKGSIGQGIRVVGRLKQSKWTDNEGKECSKVIIVAEHIEYRPLKKKKAKDEK